MAVDTAAKRGSAAGFGNRSTMPQPSGAIGDADRNHMLMLYGGIVLTSVTPPSTTIELGLGINRLQSLGLAINRKQAAALAINREQSFGLRITDG